MRNFPTILLLALLFVLAGVADCSPVIFKFGKKDTSPLTDDMKFDLKEAKSFQKTNDPMKRAKDLKGTADQQNVNNLNIQYQRYNALVSCVS
jgi:hypothetical protein